MRPFRYGAMLTPGGSRLPKLCVQKLIARSTSAHQWSVLVRSDVLPVPIFLAHKG
jgi:hypothetical protein